MNYNKDKDLFYRTYSLIKETSYLIDYYKQYNTVDTLKQIDMTEELKSKAIKIPDINDSEKFKTTIEGKLRELLSRDIDLSQDSEKSIPERFQGLAESLSNIDDMFVNGKSCFNQRFTDCLDNVKGYFSSLDKNRQEHLVDDSRILESNRRLEYYEFCSSWDKNCFFDDGKVKSIVVPERTPLPHYPKDAFFSEKHNKDVDCLLIYSPEMKSINISFNGPEINPTVADLCTKHLDPLDYMAFEGNHITIKNTSLDELYTITDRIAEKNIDFGNNPPEKEKSSPEHSM